MGFSFRGAVRALDKINDREERRKQFLQQLMEERKKVLLPVLVDRMSEINSIRKAKASRMAEATSYGLSKEAAAILESSGQLTSYNERLGKLINDPDRSISQVGIQDLSDAIVKSVPAEQAARALEYALDMGVMENPTSDGLINVLYASTDEELIDAMQTSIPSAGPSAPGIKPLSFNLRGATEMTEAQINTARKTIENSLKDSLGYSIGENNQIIWSDPDAASQIIDNAMKVYTTKVRDPLVREDPMDIILSVTDSVNKMSSDGVPLFKMANDYPTFEYTPGTYKTVADPDTTIEEQMTSPSGAGYDSIKPGETWQDYVDRMGL